jgi:hypothetical protein
MGMSRKGLKSPETWAGGCIGGLKTDADPKVRFWQRPAGDQYEKARRRGRAFHDRYSVA